jgi:hypothetical protein
MMMLVTTMDDTSVALAINKTAARMLTGKGSAFMSQHPNKARRD